MVARTSKRRIRRIPKAKRRDVTRGEYDALIDILNERGLIIADIQRTLALQFQRMAQIQAELDQVRAAWGRKRRAS